MKAINDFVKGPFKNEQEFKQAVLREVRAFSAAYTSFEIENEEKEPGMPDVLTMHAVDAAFFTEFKYADKNGVIEFTKSQPLFYKQHQDICIQILAWDRRMGGRAVFIKPSEIIDAKSLRITIPEDLEVCSLGRL